MKPKYVTCSDFVAVFTPHFRIQAEERGDGLFSESDIPLEAMWKAGIEDKCCGCDFLGGFLYYKCKWNLRRERWELELISFTPSNKFHTDNLKFAIKVSL